MRYVLLLAYTCLFFTHHFYFSQPNSLKLHTLIFKLKKWIKILEAKAKVLPSSFLLEETCRFISNFSQSTAEVELPGEFLMPKATTVSFIYYATLQRWMVNINFFMTEASVHWLKTIKMIKKCKVMVLSNLYVLTLSWWRTLSYRNQSIDLPCKSRDWFLYDGALRHERVNKNNFFIFCKLKGIVIEKHKIHWCYTA